MLLLCRPGMNESYIHRLLNSNIILYLGIYSHHLEKAFRGKMSAW